MQDAGAKGNQLVHTKSSEEQNPGRTNVWSEGARTIATTNQHAELRECTRQGERTRSRGEWTHQRGHQTRPTRRLDVPTLRMNDRHISTVNGRDNTSIHVPVRQTYVSVQRNYTLATSATMSIHSWSIARYCAYLWMVWTEGECDLPWTVSQSKPSNDDCKQLHRFPNRP